MRIGIDCRLSGNAHAGIGRYIENLIVRLPQLAPDITWVFFFYDQAQVPTFATKSENLELRFAPIKHYSLAEQLSLPSYFNEAQLDLLHIPHFNVPLTYQGKLVITIHDLLWHEYKGLLVTTLNPLAYWVKYAAYRFITTHAIAQALTIFVPSETVKQTLLRYYPSTHSKITVTTEGVSGDFKPTSQTPLLNHELVYVGSLYPHKNVEVVLKALTQLPAWKLHLVGSRTVFQDRIKKRVRDLQLDSQVVFHGPLSDQALTTLLHHSTALIQPSLSEGFGLTGVEAMSAGVPVIASDIPVFREIYQDGALYFNPHHDPELVSLLKNLTSATLATIGKKGGRVSARYSWDVMAKRTLAAYRQLLHD